MKLRENQEAGFRNVDLRIDTIRRGDGKQSTVRITHFPTGLISKIVGEEGVSTTQIRKQAFRQLRKMVDAEAKEQT